MAQRSIVTKYDSGEYVELWWALFLYKLFDYFIYEDQNCFSPTYRSCQDPTTNNAIKYVSRPPTSMPPDERPAAMAIRKETVASP